MVAVVKHEQAAPSEPVTHEQVARAVMAYDLAIDGTRPTLRERCEAMRAALTAALSERPR